MKTKWVITKVQGETETDLEAFDTKAEGEQFAMLQAVRNPGPWFFTLSEVEVPYDAV